MSRTWRSTMAEVAGEFGRPWARWLCETASGTTADEFRDELDAAPTERMIAHLDAMLARLRRGEPLQYVLGHWGFRHLDLMVDARVLIPRPETEEVAGAALERLAGRRARRCVDLGCGSGAIGLSLAVELPIEHTEVWMTDVSAAALDVARANAAGVGRPGANVRFAAGDWFAALDTLLTGTFDLVVSNPPYIALDDPELSPEVSAHEPHGALFAGADGLDALRTIIAQAPRWLAPGGWLVVEIGSSQGEAVTGLAAAAGLVDVAVLPDAAGRDRIVVARRSR